MKLRNGGELKPAAGENSNAFYQVEKVAAPIVSPKAVITPPALNQTFVYDLPTKAGQVIQLVSQ
jgi:alpha-L-fucosidase 2